VTHSAFSVRAALNEIHQLRNQDPHAVRDLIRMRLRELRKRLSVDPGLAVDDPALVAEVHRELSRGV
jgi:hypothetical protein